MVVQRNWERKFTIGNPNFNKTGNWYFFSISVRTPNPTFNFVSMKHDGRNKYDGAVYVAVASPYCW